MSHPIDETGVTVTIPKAQYDRLVKLAGDQSVVSAERERAFIDKLLKLIQNRGSGGIEFGLEGFLLKYREGIGKI